MAMDYWSQVRSIAQNLVDAEVNSALFTTNPSLALFAGRSSASMIGRPGAFEVQGGSLPNVPKPVRENIAGSVHYEIRLNSGVFGGGKWLGEHGTSPAAQNTTLVTKAAVGWAKRMDPIKIWQSDLDAAKGKYAIGNLVKTASEIAMHEAEEAVATALWSGNPTDQDADEWDNLIGLRIALDDGSNYATYGRRDRTTLTVSKGGSTYYPLKPAKYDETARQFSFDLIDEVNSAGAATRGGGVDLVLVNPALFYGKVKKLAKAEGSTASFVSGGTDMPEHGVVGFKWDLVKYGRTLIVPDPFCPAGADTTSTSMMACLSMADWVFQMHPDYAFKVSDFVQQALTTPGGDDARTAQITTKVRLACKRIDRQGFFANVN